ncbi:MAG: hypothetical protein LBV08_08040 [Clostridiales bacterium]|jgi:hypothetical protein|nr:hypothetical protein [Clostridiales bacterium]
MNSIFGGNNLILIVALLFLFGQNGNFFNCGGDNTMILILIVLFVFMQGGNFLCSEDMK